MTQRPGMYFSDRFARRGLALAERRLSYLAELYDSGRWRRFHGDADFLMMVRDARAVVETWRKLVPAEPISHSCDAVPEIAVGVSLVPSESTMDQSGSPRLRLPRDQRDAQVSSQRDHGSLLPPVSFSAYGVVADGDLTEA